MKPSDEERPVLVSMGKFAMPTRSTDRSGILDSTRPFRRMGMPVGVRREIVVFVEMEMAALPHQLEECPGPEHDHHYADATFSCNRKPLRQRASKNEKTEPNYDDHESMPERPTQSRAHSIRSASSAGCEHGQRHDVICIKGMSESEPESERQPCRGCEIQNRSPRLSVAVGRSDIARATD
jgi:hypothetical protein